MEWFLNSICGVVCGLDQSNRWCIFRGATLMAVRVACVLRWE